MAQSRAQRNQPPPPPAAELPPPPPAALEGLPPPPPAAPTAQELAALQGTDPIPSVADLLAEQEASQALAGQVLELRRQLDEALAENANLHKLCEGAGKECASLRKQLAEARAYTFKPGVRNPNRRNWAFDLLDGSRVVRPGNSEADARSRLADELGAEVAQAAKFKGCP